MNSSHDPKSENATTSAEKPFQFSLWHLFVLPVWLAVAFATGAYIGAAGVVLFVLLSCFLLGVFVRRLRWLAFASVLIWCAGLFVPVVQRPISGRRATCANNLKNVALGLLNYESTYGCFPPAYVADSSGRPLYSWRVLILPYLDRNDIAYAWNYDEPWDSPNNIKLSQITLPVFCCPSDETQQANAGCTTTNYLAVVGPGTVWPGAKSRSLAEVTDGPSNTILIVEVRHCGIHWAEPRDLQVDQMFPGVNRASGRGISSNHRGGANVCFADGHQIFLPSSVTPEQVRAMLSIAGGEKVDPTQF